MVLISGIATGEDERKVTKDDVGIWKETNQEASKSFTEVSTPSGKVQLELERNDRSHHPLQ